MTFKYRFNENINYTFCYGGHLFLCPFEDLNFTSYFLWVSIIDFFDSVWPTSIFSLISPAITETIITQVGFNSRYLLHCHSSSRVSRTKIENLKWRISGDIIQLSFRKFVTSQVQKLKILRDNNNCQSRYWLQVSFFHNILCFWTNNVTNFQKDSRIIVILDFKFLP